MNDALLAIGSISFGIVVGYVTYRTLVRKSDAAINDVAAVVAAVGGGAVAQLGDPAAFAWYSIGLLAGFAIFLVLRLKFERDPTKPLILGESNRPNDRSSEGAKPLILGGTEPSDGTILGDD